MKFFYSFLLVLVLILSSCGKINIERGEDLNEGENKVEEVNSPMIFNIDESENNFKNIDNSKELVPKKGNNQGTYIWGGKEIYYKLTKLNKEEDNKLILVIDGVEKIIDTECGRIEKIKFINDVLIYDWVCTAGMIKKIYSLEEDKEIAGIYMGNFTEDGKYIYSCGEAGYGPGYVQLFNMEINEFNDYGRKLGIGNNLIIKNCIYRDGGIIFSTEEYETKVLINYFVRISNAILVKILSKNKYSEKDRPTIDLINSYINSGKMTVLDFETVKIVQNYNYFEPKVNSLINKIAYIKDKNNYYYLCNEWPLCEGVIKIHAQTEGILTIINEYSYTVGSKLYENKFIKARENAGIELKKNATLIKDFGDDIVLKQGKGFKFGSDEESIVLYHKEERIWSNRTSFYLVRNIDVSDGNIVAFSIHDKNDPAYPIGTLVYNIKTTKIVELPYSFVVKIKKGKSGLFFIVHGPNGYSNLRLFNAEGEDINIYMGKPDSGKNSEFIKDYELMLDKKLKLLYIQGIEGIEREKIITLP